jgi:hypothetical protein
MPVHENDSSTWKATWPSIHAGGSYRNAQSTTDGVTDVYYNVSGTERMTWPLKNSVSNLTKIGVTSGQSCTTSGVLSPDGTVALSATGASTDTTDYTDNAPDTDKGGAAPTIFQWKWEVVSGTMDSTPASASTWRDLTATQTFSNSDNGIDAPADSATITVHIRAKHATASEITFNVTLSAERIVS